MGQSIHLGEKTSNWRVLTALSDKMLSEAIAVAFHIEGYESHILPFQSGLDDTLAALRPLVLVTNAEFFDTCHVTALRRIRAKYKELIIFLALEPRDLQVAFRAARLNLVNGIHVLPIDTAKMIQDTEYEIAAGIGGHPGNHEGEYSRLLSRRQCEVVHMLVNGLTNKQIARELSISHRTVEFHRSEAMQKLEVRSVAELVRMYVGHQKGWPST